MSTQKTNSKAVELIYQDTEIHYLFSNNDNVMINATEMAKVFGKRIEDFKRLEGTKAFINALLKHENSKLAHADVREQNIKFLSESDLVQTTNKATYYHRKLALEFASWLDIDFKVWIIDKIDEILFGNAKNVASKISEAEQKKINIAILTEKVRKLENEDMNKLLLELDDLKKIENERKKAVRQFSSQYKIF